MTTSCICSRSLRFPGSTGFTEHQGAGIGVTEHQGAGSGFTEYQDAGFTEYRIY